MITLLFIARFLFGLLALTCLVLLGVVTFTKSQRAKYPILKKLEELDGKQLHLIIALIVFSVITGGADLGYDWLVAKASFEPVEGPRECGLEKATPLAFKKEVEDVASELVRQAEDHFNKGNLNFKAGRYRGAAKEFRRSIHVIPTMSAYLNRGLSLLFVFDLEQAKSAFTSGLQIAKHRGHNKFQSLFLLGRGTIYISYVEDLLPREKGITYITGDLFDPEQEVRYSRAIAREEYRLAMSDFDAAIRLTPDYAIAYNERGVTYLDTGQFDKAILDFKEAIRLGPQYAKHYYNRGTAFLRKKQYRKAITDFNEAIGRNPNYLKAYTNRGLAYLRRDRTDLAISDFKKAIELRPDLAFPYLNLGFALKKAGDDDKAAQAYKKACDLGMKEGCEALSDLTNAWIAEGIVLGKLGRYKEALDAAKKAIKLKPDVADAWNIKGMALLGLGRRDEALKTFQKAIVLKPDFDLALYNLAAVYARKGQKTDALVNLKRAIEINASWKESAKKEEDFRSLWDDGDFKTLVE